MTPEQLERKIFQKWEAELLTLNEFVKQLQHHGWQKEEVYDWLCNVRSTRRPLTSHMRVKR